MEKFNVGIIGYGWVATAHIAAINACSNAQVTAIYSSRSLNDKELSKTWNTDIKIYTNLETMLSDKEIDVVSICSYPYQHKEHAVAAARAGKHIILEKPIALNWKDCLEIEEAVINAAVRSCVCFEVRFSSQFIATKAIIEQGLLGEIHYGEIDYYHGIGPWYGQYRWNIRKDAGGSALLTAGCHALDALLLCMGNDIEEVSSYETKSKSEFFKPYEFATSSVSILKFKNGTIGKCAAIVDCLQPYYFHTHLCGSEGSLLDDKFTSRKLGVDRNSWNTLGFKSLDSGDVSDHPYQTQFQNFFNSIDKNQEMPLTSLSDALKSHKIIFAADKSSELKRPVKINEDL